MLSSVALNIALCSGHQYQCPTILKYDLKPYEQRTDVHIITLVQNICIYATVSVETIIISTFSNTRKTNL